MKYIILFWASCIFILQTHCKKTHSPPEKFITEASTLAPQDLEMSKYTFSIAPAKNELYILNITKINTINPPYKIQQKQVYYNDTSEVKQTHLLLKSYSSFKPTPTDYNTKTIERAFHDDYLINIGKSHSTIIENQFHKNTSQSSNSIKMTFSNSDDTVSTDTIITVTIEKIEIEKAKSLLPELNKYDFKKGDYIKASLSPIFTIHKEKE